MGDRIKVNTEILEAVVQELRRLQDDLESTKSRFAQVDTSVSSINDLNLTIANGARVSFSEAHAIMLRQIGAAIDYVESLLEGLRKSIELFEDVESEIRKAFDMAGIGTGAPLFGQDGASGGSGHGPHGKPGHGTHGKPGHGTHGKPGHGPHGKPGHGPHGKPGHGPHGKPGEEECPPMPPVTPEEECPLPPPVNPPTRFDNDEVVHSTTVPPNTDDDEILLPPVTPEEECPLPPPVNPTIRFNNEHYTSYVKAEE